ncbi:MAG: multicopper oxidase domain-containing protein [Thermodesulfobacteriota bacterium]
MNTSIFRSPILAGLVAVALLCGSGWSGAQEAEPPGQAKKRITHADRKAAAERAAAKGFRLPGFEDVQQAPAPTAPSTDTLSVQALEVEAAALPAMVMPMPGAAPRYFSHPNYANSPLPRNIVAEWGAIAQNIVQPAPMPGMPMPMDGVSMSEGVVYLSYVQAAVYNALVAIEGGYAPYDSALAASPTASREAAVVEAAYGVLKNYFPDDPTLDARRAGYLAAIPDGAPKTDGMALGQAAAAELIALRAGDGRGDDTVTYPLPGSLDGGWVPTMMAPPIDPWMAVMTPFLLSSPDQFRPGAPPAPESPEFAAQVAAVKDIGGTTSALRTAEQTEIANFWTTNGIVQFNEAYRNVALAHGLNLLDTARLLAMGNMVGADALVACFDSKYYYNLLRPVTAIQATDPTWMPLLPTPNHPEYVAGHDCFAAAQAAVFTAALGTDQIALDLSSTATGTTRHYAAAADLRNEVKGARVWGGMHYPMSTELGDLLGNDVATYALANYFAAAPDLAPHAAVAGGIRKFVDGLAGLGPENANNLGQYIPVAVPDTTTYPGSDYYEIAVVQYREQMHSDLPGTLLRGYVQLSTDVVPGDQVALANDLLDGSSAPVAGFSGVTPPHYLGPTIVAAKNRPVRILFRNLLPTGIDGDLFIPVDTTVMGSGMGPELPNMEEMDPLNPMCGAGYDGLGTRIPKLYGCYSENRATLHLHGGISPWISDGTPHQWITPAGENTAYPQGVSVVAVPDMGDSGAPDDGAMTFYYTNQQSARLMFYHDHSWGITRLNVYAGEAAPYIITDETEQALLAQGLIPDAASTLALVIQDKTFVPSLEQLALQDETWDAVRWGGTGNLWLPHVYSPAQNVDDIEGVNQFGRWMYGPWFWPPTLGIDHGPVPNPYYDETCDPDVQWCEPSVMPGTPFNSMGMEAFMDTPVVNGTAYPTITVDPKPMRLRILNAANDRFFNLSLYVAVDANGVPCDPNNPAPAAEGTGVACTEVALNAAEVLAAKDDPFVVFPTPDEALSPKGPDWIQIATEGGFLPAPVVIPAQPTTWVNDPTVFNAGNVDRHSLLIAPAERADVIVDFSAFAGHTLIVYNDAPAAFPARDPRYDYYTDSADLTDTGGVAPILPGYGPNTRTVMRIVVAPAEGGGGPAAPFDLPALQAAFAHQADGSGVFESGQHPIIVGQQAYNSAYGTSFKGLDGLVRIFETSKTFPVLAGGTLTMPLQPKQIQDEMGEAFEHAYGRMSGFLGVETPDAQAGLQNMILYSFAHPPTEVLKGVEVPYDEGLGGLQVEPIAVTDDGTQIWKITHNGVDTHPVHFHLYEVQLLNRVGWDGIIRKPHPSELGWKDTVRVSPLEDTIVALRPVLPHIPWDLPNSIRLLDPSMPEGVYLANTTAQEALGLPIFAFDPMGEPIDIINHYVNFGWEYVWHCHILSHEEMDMMRPQAVAVAPRAPTDLTAALFGDGAERRVDLAWADASLNETGFVVQRATASTGPWSTLATVPSTVTGPTTGPITYTDPIGDTNQTFYYRVQAINVVGDTWDYSDPNLNEGAAFPTKTVSSAYSNVMSSLAFPPVASVALTADPASPQAAGAQVTFTAAAAGGSGTYEYRFWLKTGATWAVVQPYGASDTWEWNTTGLPDGTYYVQVDARNAGSTATREAAKVLAYVLDSRAPITALDLAAAPASPQQPGPVVTFTATPTGGSGSIEYRFWLRTGGVWAVVQAYGAANTWDWATAGLPAGTYYVQVDARNVGSPNARDIAKVVRYDLVAPPPAPATGVTLTADVPSPQTAGTQVTFTALGEGGSGSYEYRFWLKTGATWAVVQTYGADATWDWDTTGAVPGTYYIQVDVRSAGSTANRDAARVMGYVIQ